MSGGNTTLGRGVSTPLVWCEACGSPAEMEAPNGSFSHGHVSVQGRMPSGWGLVQLPIERTDVAPASVTRPICDTCLAKLLGRKP